MTDMMLTGRVYNAQEGERVGLAQYLVPNGTALTKAIELASRIATNAPLTNFALVHALPRIAELKSALASTRAASADALPVTLMSAHSWGWRWHTCQSIGWSSMIFVWAWAKGASNNAATPYNLMHGWFMDGIFRVKACLHRLEE